MRLSKASDPSCQILQQHNETSYNLRLLPSIIFDYFRYGGQSYLVVEDRNRSLPGAEVSDNGSKELITCLKQLFVIFDVSDELSSDEGTETSSHKTQTFPKN